MTKIACAVNGVGQRGRRNHGKDEWALPCVNHQMVPDHVRQLKPKILLMTETYSWAVRLTSHAKGPASAKEWLAADQRFVDSVARQCRHGGHRRALDARSGDMLKGDYLHTSVQYARQLAPDSAHLMRASGVSL